MPVLKQHFFELCFQVASLKEGHFYELLKKDKLLEGKKSVRIGKNCFV